MEIKGKIIAKLPTTKGVSANGKEWEKQDFVVETTEQYPKKLAITVMGNDKIQQVPPVGSEVKVDFNHDAKEYNGKWYNSINLWKIEVISKPDLDF